MADSCHFHGRFMSLSCQILYNFQIIIIHYIKFISVSWQIHVTFMLLSWQIHVTFMSHSLQLSNYHNSIYHIHISFMADSLSLSCYFHGRFMLLSCHILYNFQIVIIQYIIFMSVSCHFHATFMADSCHLHTIFSTTSKLNYHNLAIPYIRIVNFMALSKKKCLNSVSISMSLSWQIYGTFMADSGHFH